MNVREMLAGMIKALLQANSLNDTREKGDHRKSTSRDRKDYTVWYSDVQGGIRNGISVESNDKTIKV